jgi:hypothetical protein
MARKQLQDNTLIKRALAPSLVAASLLLAACAGTPPEGTVASEDMECVMVPVTGSRMPLRDCRPREVWEAIAAAQREAAANSARDIILLDEAGNAALGADSLGF